LARITSPYFGTFGDPLNYYLKGAPLIVPETIVIPRDGSCAEALSGSLRMVQELISNSFASKWMVDIVPYSLIILTLFAKSSLFV